MDAVEHDSDRTCCMCRVPGRPYQIHHLDGNSSNNSVDNLAVLCLDHHHEATAGPGLGRGLSAGVIRKYRDEWLRQVRSRREHKDAAARHALTRPELLVEAVATLEVRKLAWLLSKPSWKETRDLLEQLEFYADRFCGDAVSDEVMEALDGPVGRTRFDMPPDVADRIGRLIPSVAGVPSLVAPSRRRIPRHRRELLRRALQIGVNVTYDAVKYLGDIKVVAAGARIMFQMLRYAKLNRLSSLAHEALREFRSLEDLATQCGFEDARRWLAFERQDALCVGDTPSPEYPRDVARRI